IIQRKLERLDHGLANETDLKDLKNWGTLMKNTSRCGLGKTATNSLSMALIKFDPMPTPIQITIDGQNIHTEEGKNLVMVARENGIFIPSLCYYPHIEPPLGTCRVCTCKINGKFAPACTEKAAEGLSAEVNTPELKDTRKALVEMMFAEGNHICPACEKSGNCDLQHMGY